MASSMQSYAARGGWTKPVVIYGLALVVIPLGVFCDFYYAARGELGLAAIWMMITLCSIGVLGLYVRFVNLRHQLRGQTKSLDRLQRELSVMLQSADASVEQANRASVLPDVSPELIAGRLETDLPIRSSAEGTPPLKLVGADEPGIADQPPEAGVIADRPTNPSTTLADPPTLVGAGSSSPSFSPGMMHLRREFADHVRSESFADALATGMEIAAAFPQSAAAAEFDRLRPLLLRRLGLTASVSESLPDPASAEPGEGSVEAEQQPPMMVL